MKLLIRVCFIKENQSYNCFNMHIHDTFIPIQVRLQTRYALNRDDIYYYLMKICQTNNGDHFVKSFKNICNS